MKYRHDDYCVTCYSVDDLTRIDSVENLTADDDVPEFTRGRVTDLIKVRNIL